ncbi:MAG: thiamine pyrophosphate-dependent enzyme [Kiritimatiellia bacterium]|nr:thiamine pyrophosphate-dependent enzyme [Kiritimatiellia bacterium]
MTHPILLGDEAVAQGAIDSGIRGAYAYPGTPSTEIMEFIIQSAPQTGIHARWSANEKVAYEEALGMSYAGKRSLVIMKHVGLNVAADPFMNSASTGAHGGLVLAVADDPGMHSSQNEQDSRFYADFAQIPCFEPDSQQTAYDLTREAFILSERLQIPVMIRMVTRLSHSRTGVTTAPPDPAPTLPPESDWARWTLVPMNARAQYRKLLDKQPEILKATGESVWNSLRMAPGAKQGIIACGIAGNYVAEQAEACTPPFSLLMIRGYPFSMESIEALARDCDDILVLEEGYPFVERQVRILCRSRGIRIRGRLSGDLPRAGELNPDLVGQAMGIAPRVSYSLPDWPAFPARPPKLCKGCPHIDFFRAIREVMNEFPGSRPLSDIGCYALGGYPPYNAIVSCVDMGASISMAKGAAEGGVDHPFAIIGDSTFAHSGMTPLLGAIRENTTMTVCILDNGTVAMTGAQETMATGEKLDNIVLGLGVPRENILPFTPLPSRHDDNVRMLRTAMKTPGLTVVISRRECVQIAKKNKKSGTGNAP